MPGIPELHLTGFDGPMDLLLDLAERQRIDLGQISLLQLAEQFVAALARLEPHVALERRADCLVMATRLLLRSRLLFPAGPKDEAEAAQEAGREARRLDQVMVVRAAAAWLDRQPQIGRDVFIRPQGRNPRVTSNMALMEACLTVLRGREGQPGIEEPVYRPAPVMLFRVDEAMARIRALLAERQGRPLISSGVCRSSGAMIRFARERRGPLWPAASSPSSNWRKEGRWSRPRRSSRLPSVSAYVFEPAVRQSAGT